MKFPQARSHFSEGVNRLYTDILKRGKRPLIIDGGANIGASVLWFASKYPAAHIVAIEPAPDNCSLLRKNVQQFGVDIWQVGLGASEDSLNLIDPGYGEWAYRTVKGETGIKVRIVTLEGVIATKHNPALFEPFLLKVDIEGGEAGMFDGNDNPARLFPVIVIELHDWMLPGEGSSESFLRFHTETRRDFIQRGENIFSIQYSMLPAPTQQ